jgi:hypothetical protein
MVALALTLTRTWIQTRRAMVAGARAAGTAVAEREEPVVAAPAWETQAPEAVAEARHGAPALAPSAAVAHAAPDAGRDRGRGRGVDVPATTIPGVPLLQSVVVQRLSFASDKYERLPG